MSADRAGREGGQHAQEFQNLDPPQERPSATAAAGVQIAGEALPSIDLSLYFSNISLFNSGPGMTADCTIEKLRVDQRDS